MSPKAFDDCVKTPGSKKVTKSLGDDKYVHGCQFPGGEWVWGEVKRNVGSKLKEALRK